MNDLAKDRVLKGKLEKQEVIKDIVEEYIKERREKIGNLLSNCEWPGDRELELVGEDETGRGCNDDDDDLLGEIYQDMENEILS